MKLTYSDYVKTPEGEWWELINGESIKLLSLSEAHQSAQINLGARMFLHTQGMGLGNVYLAPFDVVLSDTDTVRPDLFFVAKERLHIMTADNVQGAPELVVEIRSLDCTPRLGRQEGAIRPAWCQRILAGGPGSDYCCHSFAGRRGLEGGRCL